MLNIISDVIRDVIDK